MSPTRTVLTDEQIAILWAQGRRSPQAFVRPFARDIEYAVLATLAASTPAEPLIPLSAALAAVPPGSWCDPQRVADALRAIPVAPQADAADAARWRWLCEQDGLLKVFNPGEDSDTYRFTVRGTFVKSLLDPVVDAALSAPTEPAAEPAKGDAL